MEPRIQDYLKELPDPEKPRFWSGPDEKLLAWNEYGDPQGRPVFYYHGWPSSRWQARLAHHLGYERGLRVIAMDRPGIGRSDMGPERRLEAWPGLMESFADSLEIGKFAQLGVSGGGPYVMACAAEIPHRLVGSAVLCGAVPLSDAKGGMRGLHPIYRLMALIRRMPAGLFSGLFCAASLVALRGASRFPLSALIRSLPQEDRTVLMDHPEAMPVLIQSFCEGVRQGGRGVMADADIYFQRWPFRFAEMISPIRYWHGGEDRNIPLVRVRELVARIPAAQLVEESHLGHFSLAIRRAPDALDYLAECHLVHA